MKYFFALSCIEKNLLKSNEIVCSNRLELHPNKYKSEFINKSTLKHDIIIEIQRRGHE